MLTRLTPVATLIDTRQQSASTSFNTQTAMFSWHLSFCAIGVMHDKRVIPMPKERLLGKSYKRNQIHLRWTKPKILTVHSVAITKTGRQSNLQSTATSHVSKLVVRGPNVAHHIFSYGPRSFLSPTPQPCLLAQRCRNHRSRLTVPSWLCLIDRPQTFLQYTFL